MISQNSHNTTIYSSKKHCISTSQPHTPPTNTCTHPVSSPQPQQTHSTTYLSSHLVLLSFPPKRSPNCNKTAQLNVFQQTEKKKNKLYKAKSFFFFWSSILLVTSVIEAKERELSLLKYICDFTHKYICGCICQKNTPISAPSFLKYISRIMGSNNGEEQAIDGPTCTLN